MQSVTVSSCIDSRRADASVNVDVISYIDADGLVLDRLTNVSVNVDGISYIDADGLVLDHLINEETVELIC